MKRGEIVREPAMTALVEIEERYDTVGIAMRVPAVQITVTHATWICRATESPESRPQRLHQRVQGSLILRTVCEVRCEPLHGPVEEFVFSERPRVAGRKGCHRPMKTRDGASVGAHVVHCRLLTPDRHTGSAGEQHGIPRPLRRTHGRQPLSIEPDDRYSDVDAVRRGVEEHGGFIPHVFAGAEAGPIDPEKPGRITVLNTIAVVGAAIMQGARAAQPIRLLHENGDRLGSHGRIHNRERRSHDAEDGGKLTRRYRLVL